MTTGELRRDWRLDALRGAAALSVAVGHCATAVAPRPLYDKTFWQIDLASPTEILLRAAHVIFNADAAVLIFFVLSGHVLFESLARISRRYPAEFAAYGVKRIFRIMPVLILAIAPFALIKNLPWQNTIACMLLLRTDALGLTWTLQVEMIGSLLVFVALLAWRSHPLLLAGLFALILAIAVAGYPNYLFYFLPILLIGCAVQRLKSLCRPHDALFWGGIAALLLADLAFGKGVPALLLVTAGATLLVANASTPSARFLDRSFFHWVGRLSYSLYLFHPLSMYMSVRMSQALAIDPHSLPPVAGFLFLAVTSVGLTLFFALLIHRYVEQPGIAAGRRFAGHIQGESRTALAPSIAGSAKSAGSKPG